eukprot:Filipodium_phascolosomae@DN1960_c0_g1_i1.p2
MAAIGGQEPEALLGRQLYLITASEIRYEGTLAHIDLEGSTVSLCDCRCLGTEGRRSPEVPPSDQIFAHVKFSGKDVKDVQICDPSPNPFKDPAVVSYME